jgi:hypothetical protein
MDRQNLFSDRWDGENEAVRTRYRIFFRPDEARMGATLYELAPGAPETRMHMHFGAEEMFFVLSGRPLFRNQHGKEELAPGDFVFGAAAGIRDPVLRQPDSEDVVAGSPRARVSRAGERPEIVRRRCKRRLAAVRAVDSRRGGAVASVLGPADADRVAAGLRILRVRAARTTPPASDRRGQCD